MEMIVRPIRQAIARFIINMDQTHRNQGGSDAPVVDEDVDSALERRSQAMRDREAQVAKDWAAVENLVELARSYAK